MKTPGATVQRRGVGACLIAAWAFGLVACGGGSSAPPAPPSTYTIGGTVSGLVRPFSLALSNNAGDTLTVSANGAFVFSQRLTTGSAYAVSLSTAPPGQSCTVTQGSGSVASASVDQIRVQCEVSSDFGEVTGAVTDALSLYTFTDPVLDPSGTPVLRTVKAMDVDGDGKPELIMVLSKGWGNAFETRSARSRVTVLKLDAQYQFTDITSSVMSATNSLAGYAMAARVVDFNGDGKPDLLVALSQDDGRLSGNGSLTGAAQAVWMSSGDGKYRWETYGDAGAWSTVNTGRDTTGRWFAMGGGSFTLPNDSFVFGGGLITRNSGLAPNVNATAFEFLGPTASSASDTLVTVPTAQLMGLEAYVRTGVGSGSAAWSVANTVAPMFPKVGSVQVRAVSGSLATAEVLETPRGTILGQGSGVAIRRSCQIRLQPAGPALALFSMPHWRLTNFISGQTVAMSDLTPGALWVGASMSSGVLTRVNLTVRDEEVDGVQVDDVECRDINGDGYDDMIVYPLRQGTSNAAPIVYLNARDGTFFKSTFSQTVPMRPQQGVPSQTSVVADFDGDGVMDIVILPATPPQDRSASAYMGTVKLFKGMRALTR